MEEQLTPAVHAEPRVAAWRCLVLALACSLALITCHAEAPQELVLPATISCPPGTLEISALDVNGTTVVAALRDAKSGLFAPWQLDLRIRKWTRLAKPSQRRVLAIGADDRGGFLLIGQTGRGSTAFRPGRFGLRRLEVLPDDWVVRAVTWDAVESCWWVAGRLESGGDRYLVGRLNGSVAPRNFLPAEAGLVRSMSGREHGDVALHGSELLVSNMLECSIRSWDRKSESAALWVDLNVVLPGFSGPCPVTELPDPDDSEAWEEWTRSHDVVVRLEQVAGGFLALIRRGLNSWTLLTLAREGGRVTGRRDLPWGISLHGAAGDFVILESRGATEAGQPVRLEVQRISDLMAGRPVPGEMSDGLQEFEVELVESSEASASLAGEHVLFLDPRHCVGDLQREIAVARSGGQLDGRASYVLAVVAPAKPGVPLKHAQIVSRHLRLGGRVLEWNGDVPATAISIAPGLLTWTPTGDGL